MQNQLENRAYAGFFVRLLAFCVDMIIASMVVGMFKLPFSMLASDGANFLKAPLLFHYSFLDIFGYLGMVAYFILLTYFAHSTIGKMLFRLQIVCDKEWTFWNVFYRETIGRFLSSLLNIGYLAVIVTTKKQGFHDMLCDTYVVYKNMYVEQKQTKVVAPVEPAHYVQPVDMGQMNSMQPLITNEAENTETLVKENPVTSLVEEKSADIVSNTEKPQNSTSAGYHYYDVQPETANVQNIQNASQDTNSNFGN